MFSFKRQSGDRFSEIADGRNGPGSDRRVNDALRAKTGRSLQLPKSSESGRTV
jgi:hypothetical protein